MGRKRGIAGALNVRSARQGSGHLVEAARGVRTANEHLGRMLADAWDRAEDMELRDRIRAVQDRTIELELELCRARDRAGELLDIGFQAELVKRSLTGDGDDMGPRP